MIALQLAAAVVVGLVLAAAVRAVEERYRAWAAARRQAAWDAHVAAAVEQSATPLYEAIAAEYARDLDTEWKRLSTGGWATE